VEQRTNPWEKFWPALSPFQLKKGNLKGLDPPSAF
jgi:hypothetical protein